MPERATSALRWDASRRSEKSAEAIVAAGARRRRAEHEEPNRREGFMDERDAGKKAEKPERAGRVGGGTAEGTDAARQAFRASGEQAGDETVGLMEEVLRRENLMAAC